jgi:hypothetical protein
MAPLGYCPNCPTLGQRWDTCTRWVSAKNMGWDTWDTLYMSRGTLIHRADQKPLFSAIS